MAAKDMVVPGTSAVDWWYRSTHMTEGLGSQVVASLSTTYKSMVPDMTLTQDYATLYRQILVGLDAQLVIMTTVPKASPVMPLDYYVDHRIFGRNGSLHVRVDATTGDEMDGVVS